MDHLSPQIVIGPTANAAEPRLASGRVLAWHEADPCRKLPPRAKMAAVVDRGDERCCDHRSDAWQLREPMASFIRPTNSRELPVELRNPKIEGVELFEHVVEEPTCKIGEFSRRDGVARLL